MATALAQGILKLLKNNDGFCRPATCSSKLVLSSTKNNIIQTIYMMEPYNLDFAVSPGDSKSQDPVI